MLRTLLALQTLPQKISSFSILKIGTAKMSCILNVFMYPHECIPRIKMLPH